MTRGASLPKYRPLNDGAPWVCRAGSGWQIPNANWEQEPDAASVQPEYVCRLCEHNRRVENICPVMVAKVAAHGRRFRATPRWSGDCESWRLLLRSGGSERRCVRRLRYELGRVARVESCTGRLVSITWKESPSHVSPSYSICGKRRPVTRWIHGKKEAATSPRVTIMVGALHVRVRRVRSGVSGND